MLGTPSGVTGALTTNVGQLQISAGAGTIVTTAVGGGGTPTLNFVNTTPLTRGAGAVRGLRSRSRHGDHLHCTAPTLTNGLIGGYAYFTNATTGAVDFCDGRPATAGPRCAYAGYTTGLPVSGSTSTVNYLSNASVATTAAESVNALKITGAQTLTLGGVLTIGTRRDCSVRRLDAARPRSPRVRRPSPSARRLPNSSSPSPAALRPMR